MKKRFVKTVCTGLAVIMLAGMLFGCGSGGDTDSETDGGGTNAEGLSGKTLNVGLMPASVGVPVQYAYDQGYFEEEGLDVELFMFQTGAPINEAIAAGQIDVAASGAATIFSLANGNCTLLTELCSSGGMGIYVRPDSPILEEKGELKEHPDMYGSVDTLEGITILGQLGTSSQLNAAKYMEAFGLETDDYTLMHMDAGPAYQAFVAGEGDALATYPPYSFSAQADGMVEICTFEDATGFSILDSVFGRNDVVEERPDDIIAFLKCVMKASEELKDDELRKEYTTQFYADNGREYSEQDMDDEIRARRYMGKEDYEQGDYSFGKCFTDQSEFYVENGQITEDQIPNIYNSLDPSYLNSAIGTDLKPETQN